MKKLLLTLPILVLLTGVMSSCDKQQYYVNQGYVFGTYYNIRYEAEHDLEADVLAALKEMDASLSMFNQESTLSRINRGETTETDSLFELMYATAMEISELSEGAFDITVRPLVNLWGFGNKKAGRTEAPQVEQATIDSTLAYVGYQKVTLQDHHITKADERLSLDASAIAKGFGVDIAAQTLAQHGCKNYLVDIGGEVVAEGVNAQHEAWRIGINKPEDDPDGTKHDIQEIIHSNHIALATSGNYRQYYQDGDIRRSHTIDPRTGYPVEHTLLSASVTANNCMRADALATACMVLGEEKGMALIERIEDAECYLIVSEGTEISIKKSSNWGRNAKK